jgi:hypothetical protein
VKNKNGYFKRSMLVMVENVDKFPKHGYSKLEIGNCLNNILKALIFLMKHKKRKFIYPNPKKTVIKNIAEK